MTASVGWTVRRELRAATQERHARLDRALLGVDLADPRAYRDYLLGQLRAHAEAEQLLRSVPGLWALHGWSRLPGLRADLADLAHAFDLADAFDDRAPTTGATTEVTPWPCGSSASPAARWVGVAYVVEGSMLGQRHLVAEGPATDAWARPERFLRSTGVDVSRRWPQTLDLVERHGSTSLGVATSAACWAFDLFATRLGVAAG